MPMDDPSHTAIIEWMVGIIMVVGGSILGIVAKMVKSKKSRVECDLLHQAINSGLIEIKQKLEKGDTKMDGMNLTLVKIATTLEVRSKDETDRYARHSEEWKDE